MKKKLLTWFIIITFTPTIFTMDTKNTPIQLPSEQILKNRLHEMHLQNFVTKTNINTTLGNQNRTPVDVVMDVELALYDYDQHNQNQGLTAQMEIRKPEIIKTILQDHPQALEYLKQKGLLKDI